MRISQIRASNFKSLVDFDMPLAKFTCLVGMNGSGKSTVLQFVDFLSQLVRGRIDTWLEDRSWAKEDLSWRIGHSDQIEFEITFVDDAGQFSMWEGAFGITPRLKCTRETFTGSGQELTFPRTPSQPTTTLPLESPLYAGLAYQGSVLAILDEPVLPPWVKAIKDFLLGLHSQELLSPELMRSRPRQSAGTVGARGEGLAAYFYELSDDKRQQVLSRLKTAYPQLESVQSKALRAGWKQLSINEVFGATTLQTEARHINDGMLRLMAIVAELESEHSCLLFDEIENGVNTELAQFVVEILVASRQQVLVTTHSPVILNYLSDEVAKEAVVYLYKTPAGKTQAVRLFDIPLMAKKLTMMGPGEAYGDTNLYRLNNEVLEMQAGATGNAVPAER